MLLFRVNPHGLGCKKFREGACLHAKVKIPTSGKIGQKWGTQKAESRKPEAVSRKPEAGSRKPVPAYQLIFIANWNWRASYAAVAWPALLKSGLTAATLYLFAMLNMSTMKSALMRSVK